LKEKEVVHLVQDLDEIEDETEHQDHLVETERHVKVGQDLEVKEVVHLEIEALLHLEVVGQKGLRQNH
jgi:hypothetical protein